MKKLVCLLSVLILLTSCGAKVTEEDVNGTGSTSIIDDTNKGGNNTGTTDLDITASGSMNATGALEGMDDFLQDIINTAENDTSTGKVTTSTGTKN